MRRRPYLVYCPTATGSPCAELFGEDRLFDVALNHFSGTITEPRAEYSFNLRMHKWPAIDSTIHYFADAYDYVSFIDDDIAVSTAQLNTLFVLGKAFGLSLYQPALTHDSHFTWPATLQARDSLVRPSRFVEIMMPFFSRDALAKCRTTFSESESGWGLDFIWPQVLEGQGMAIIDAVPVRHTRPVTSFMWRTSLGETPHDELVRCMLKYNVGALGTDAVS